MLTARLFGGLSVEIDGRRVPSIPGFKARSLFAYLLLHPGPHPRIRLAGTFWPDVLDASARGSLRVALWTVRRALDAVGGQDHLAADRLTAGLPADAPRAVDTERFDALLADGDPQSLTEAVALYRGPLLANLPDEWVLDAQEHYRIRVADACERLGGHAEAAGDLRAAAEWARRALGHDPVRESCHAALMARLAANGRGAEALAAYSRCVALLDAELGVAPTEETQTLARRIRARGTKPSGADPRAGVDGQAGASVTPAVTARPIVGRDSELGVLRALFAAAIAGAGPRVALVRGKAGIGKTRLAAELSRWAAAGTARCATGCGLELGGGPPFAMWTEILRDLLMLVSAPPDSVAWPADLARLVPSVTTRWGRAPSPPSSTPELELARLFDAIAEFLRSSALDRPLLLVLDDLHVADTASLALLASLGRRLDDVPIFVVGTRRPGPPNPDLDTVLEGLRRRGLLADEIALGPLDEVAVRSIVAEAAPGLDEEAVRTAVAGADGIPLFAREGARAVAHGRKPSEGLRGLVRGPLGRLSPPARLLIDIAAAVARPLDSGEAADLVGVDTLAEAQRCEALDELLDVAGDRRIRFGHSLLREACYQELSPARRARLHASIAEGFAGRPGRSAAEVARHYQEAGDAGAACGYFVIAAADARGLGALPAAASLLRQAAALAVGDAANEAEIWLTLADVEAWRGLRPAWEEAFGRASELLAAAGNHLGLAEANAFRGGWLHTTLCYPREALTAYRQSLDLIHGHGLDAPELEATALAGAAWGEAIAGDPNRVEALAAASEVIPEVGGDLLLAAEVAFARSAALIRMGKMVEAEPGYEEVARLAQEAGRPDLARVSLATIASAAACRGDFARALEVARLAQKVSSGGLYEDMIIHAGEAHALSRLGRHAEALSAAKLEVGVAARSASPEHEAMADYDLGVVAFAAGRPDDAVVRLAGALARPGARFFSRPQARLLLAEARLATGDGVGAQAEIDAMPHEPIGPADLPDAVAARLNRLNGLIAASRGEQDSALRYLDEASQAWRKRLARGEERIWVHAARTSTGDLFAANVVDLGRPPMAGLVEPGVELGRVLADRATVLAAAGRLAEAARSAGEAAELADALGFDGYRSQLEPFVVHAAGGI